MNNAISKMNAWEIVNKIDKSLSKLENYPSLLYEPTKINNLTRFNITVIIYF